MQKSEQKMKPNEMTGAEKSQRVFYLECKYFDIATRASSLLMSEIERTGLTNDLSLQNGVQQLRLMEHSIDTLQQEYDAAITRELIPITRGFEQQRLDLVRQHKQERDQIYASSNPLPTIKLDMIKTRQRRELDNLVETQKKQKEDLKKHLGFNLDVCKKDMFATFMKFINQIYK